MRTSRGFEELCWDVEGVVMGVGLEGLCDELVEDIS